MNQHESHPAVKTEEDVLPPRLLVYVLLAVLGFSAVLAGISYAIQRSREKALRPSGLFPEMDLGPIRVRSNVEETLFTGLGAGQVLMIQGRQRLERFDWIGDDKRRVKVPIDVAMDLVAAEGGARK